MPKVSPEHLKDRRDGIVSAARAEFAANGFERTSIGDIARMAGTSDGLIYRYFNGKRELLSAALASFYAEKQTMIAAEIEARSDYSSKLGTLVEQHVRVFASDMEMCRLFISEVRNLEDYVGSAAQMLNRRYTALLIPVIDAGIEEGAISPDIDRKLVRDMLFGGIEHIAWSYISAGNVIDVEKVSAAVTATFLRGLSAL